MRNFVLTSASVTDGHPDKLCDRISDAILDGYLAIDPSTRMTAECAIASSIVFVAAHVESAAQVDLPGVVQRILGEVGYTEPRFNPETVTVLTAISPRSGRRPTGLAPPTEASQGISSIATVNTTVFGFACRHTEEMLPMSIALAHRLARRLSEVRRNGIIEDLHPDGQAQVSVRYEDRRPVAIEGVTLIQTLSAQAGNALPDEGALRAEVIAPVLRTSGLAVPAGTEIMVNPAGAAPPGGPSWHAGLTGRKNDIDTFGGYARHGGAALSGKDPSRMDRTGAYAARHLAKNVVASGLADECEVQLSYAIGRPEPLSIEIDTFGTGRLPDARIATTVREQLDLGVAAILRRFALGDRPGATQGRFFTDLAAFGHVGRLDLDLPWEKSDITAMLERGAA